MIKINELNGKKVIEIGHKNKNSNHINWYVDSVKIKKGEKIVFISEEPGYSSKKISLIMNYDIDDLNDFLLSSPYLFNGIERQYEYGVIYYISD